MLFPIMYVRTGSILVLCIAITVKRSCTLVFSILLVQISRADFSSDSIACVRVGMAHVVK